MKKSLILLIFLFFITACSNENSEDVFTLKDSEIQKYNEIIKQQLQQQLWEYNEQDNSFALGVAEQTDSPKFEDIYKASLDMGIDVKKYSGSQAIIANVLLKHFNNEDAGKAYFYFVGDKLVCEYYVFENKIYSLKDKDVFLKETNFKNFEDINVKAEFESKEIGFAFSDYADINKKNIAVIDEESKLSIYNYGKKGFTKTKALSFENEGFYPIDFSFYKNGAVVLLGKLDDQYKNSQSHESVEYEDEHSSDNANEAIKYHLKSWQLIFLDSNYNKQKDIINLDLSTYGNISVVGDNIFLSRDKSIDIFQKINGVWAKTNQIMLKNDIHDIKFADIDNDSIDECVISDGMDLYLYSYDESFELLWRTNLSINSIKGNIYVDDLNKDGIKEIYIEDLSDNSYRYILTSSGFTPSSLDIGYGKKCIPADFNDDGMIDYVIIDNSEGENKVTINLGK